MRRVYRRFHGVMSPWRHGGLARKMRRSNQRRGAVRLRWLGLLIVMGGCAADGLTGAVELDQAAAVAACAAAVAAHVGKPTDAVVASWSGPTAAGGGLVTVTDAQSVGAERLHSCEVDAGGRVVAILHPGA
jgi:hypothetical protein